MKKIHTNILLTDFNEACQKGNIEYVKYLFDNHSGILITDFSSGIWIASKEDKTEIVKLFLKLNKTKNFITVEDLNYALYYAIKNINYNMFELILNQNICDLKYEPHFINSILKTLDFSNDNENIKSDKQKIIEIIFNYKKFLTSVIEYVHPSDISYYIKKHIFYNNLVDFNSTIKSKMLLSRTIMDIAIINDIDFLNDILYKYTIDDDDDINHYLTVSILNNSMNILEKILTLNNINLGASMLYSIDYEFSKPNGEDIHNAFKMLLDDGRIFDIIKKNIYRLDYNILHEVMIYLNVKSKVELINMFEFL